MSLSDNDTTIVAGLADAGQRMSSLSTNIGSLQALLGNVANTVMDPGTAVAGTMPSFLDVEPTAFPRNVARLVAMPMFDTARDPCPSRWVVGGYLSASWSPRSGCYACRGCRAWHAWHPSYAWRA